ncbi:hypothetical protein AB0O07_35430 [Streptomyces sp. NPDC093085]|uniref:hypothetical protein n=1 Tax=Streptomyces sp. NPDC093085 TaxID=3155068 RepID=UPI003413DBED
MQARTHSRPPAPSSLPSLSAPSAPSSALSSRSAPYASAGGDLRLPWWAVALPVIAFVALFLLVAEPGQAHAASTEPAVGRILGQLHLTLAR